MARFRVGVQLHPQATTVDELRAAWKAADALGVDSIWIWDHFYPLYGDPDAAHFEAYTLLAAMAVDTQHARLGAARDVQLVPQPRTCSPTWRARSTTSAGGRFVPRHRLGLVRARLRRVRLRVRHRARPPARRSVTRSRASWTRLGKLDAAARRVAPDPHRRRRREGHAAARRRARRRVEHVRAARELRAQERGARRLVRRSSAATRGEIERTVGIGGERDRRLAGLPRRRRRRTSS